MTRLKFAELTSGVGALVLGVGLGALFPQWPSGTITNQPVKSIAR